jgi:hypothetical protein
VAPDATLLRRSPVELQQIVQTERLGHAFLVWRDESGAQQIYSLGGRRYVTVGRRPSNDIVLLNDKEVSRTHAELELVGEDWTVNDDGLSRNGTFLDGVRITQRKRLGDRDVLRFGSVLMEYRRPSTGTIAVTVPAAAVMGLGTLTEIQHKILVALCRPYYLGGPYASPATNTAIAEEVFLGLDAVKNHLRILFQRFELTDVPQNQKRRRLAEYAFQWGLVSNHDLL